MTHYLTVQFFIKSDSLQLSMVILLQRLWLSVFLLSGEYLHFESPGPLGLSCFSTASAPFSVLAVCFCLDCDVPSLFLLNIISGSSLASSRKKTVTAQGFCWTISNSALCLYAWCLDVD